MRKKTDSLDPQQQEVQKIVTLELLMDSFHSELERVMHEAGLSQNELARRLNLTASSVSQTLGHGNLTASSMANIAAATGHRIKIEFKPIR